MVVVGSYPSTEVQSVYSTAPATLIGFKLFNRSLSQKINRTTERYNTNNRISSPSYKIGDISNNDNNNNNNDDDDDDDDDGDNNNNLTQKTRPYNNQPQQKKRICKILDFAVPADHRIKLKECEKKDKYLDLARELKKQKKTNSVT